MNTRIKRLAALGAALSVIATAAPATAVDKMVIDIQGVSPKRVIVYLNDHSTEKTAVGAEMMGPVRIREIDLTMVYEAADQPYWTETSLQFKCPNALYGKKPPRKGKPDEVWTLPDADSVEARMERGRKRMKNSPDVEVLPGGGWQTASNYLMLQVYRVACNDMAISEAKTAAVIPGDKLDPAKLRQSMRTLGLDTAEFLPAEGLSTNLLASYTWEHFWKDVPKPTLNNGRKLTDAEAAAVEKQLMDQIAMLEKHVADVGGRLKQMDAENKFIGDAAKLRGGRKVSSTEQSLISVWLGKNENDVVAAMGAPNVTEAGGLRFLTYFKEYDARYALVRPGGEVVSTQGLYESCQAQFVLKPDSGGALRVADVVVDETRSGPGRAYVCSEILNVPRS